MEGGIEFGEGEGPEGMVAGEDVAAGDGVQDLGEGVGVVDGGSAIGAAGGFFFSDKTTRVATWLNQRSMAMERMRSDSLGRKAVSIQSRTSAMRALKSVRRGWVRPGWTVRHADLSREDIQRRMANSSARWGK